MSRELALIRDPAVMARFWLHVNVADSGCWLWNGAGLPGYGRLRAHGKGYIAHRVAYTWAKGAIPDGLHIDHLCRTPPCVNPDHLEAVTMQENVRRGNSPGALAKRTNRCKCGHHLTPENVYLKKDGRRNCKPCDTESQRRRRGVA